MASVPTLSLAGGVTMPQIVYGTAWKKERTAALVAEAIAQGFRGIDTACQPRHYDEAGVGAGLAAALGRGLAREHLYLQTKFSPLDAHDPERVPYDADAPVATQVRQSFDRSLENLATNYLDGLILHSPLATPAATLEAWRALESIQADGGTKLIGISNCYSPELFGWLCNEARIAPAILQNRFHAATGYDRELRAFCRDRGIVYQSFWTLTANPDVLADPVVLRLAGRHGRTPAEILFRYLTQAGVVPLTGTTSRQHMQQDLSIFSFALAAAEQNEVMALLG